MSAMNQLVLTLAYANDWNPTRLLGTLSFALTSGLCGLVVYLCFLRRQRRDPGHSMGLWIGLLVAQLAMLVELQTSMRFDAGEVLRSVIRDMDLYENRRQLQAMAFVVVAIPMIAIYSTAFYMVRKRGLPVILAVGGTLASLSLFCLPLISLHAIDRIMYHHIGPVMLISLMWFGSAAVTFAGGVKAMIASRNALFSRVNPRDSRHSQQHTSRPGARTQRSPRPSTNPREFHNSGRRV